MAICTLAVTDLRNSDVSQDAGAEAMKQLEKRQSVERLLVKLGRR